MLVKTIKNITTGLLVTMALSGCTHKFNDYNTDPNRVEMGQLEPGNLMEEMLFKAVDGYLYRTWRINGELMQYTVMTATTDQFHRYIIPIGDHQNAWNHLTRWAAHADHMCMLAQEQNDVNYEAIGLTLRALFMCDLVSLYGDVPFSEAFKARTDEVLQPKFDTQEEVFTSLIADLEKANTLYNLNKELKKSNKDLLYGGNLKSWRKFTNSLYVRVLMRMSNVKPELVTEKLSAVVANPGAYPVFQTNEDNARFNFTGDTPNENRFGVVSETAFTSLNRKAAMNIINLMSASEDPRIGNYFVISGDEWRGVVSGENYSQTTATSNKAAILNQKVLGTYTAPYCIMHATEVNFLLAEAAQLGLIPGGNAEAKRYYDIAITESLRYWSSINPNLKGEVIPDDEIAIFLENELVTYNGSYARIMEQKYIAMFWCGYESFHDYRRTGHPTLSIGSATQNNGTLPTRLLYPETTLATNGENCRVAIQRMGGDTMQTKLWWSK
ncbi:MAG: SusD/RagB family nutrient-binding outer membrane lipoprotein [Marinifilaceae bacterium]